MRQGVPAEQREAALLALKCSHASKELTLPLDDMIADFIKGMRVVDLVEKYGFAEATIFEHLARAGRRFPPRPVAQQIRFVGHDVRPGEFASNSFRVPSVAAE
jgi:hypothetical protein